MAEAAVCLVIDKLVSLLAQEVTLLKDVHGEVAEMKDDLEVIRAFLKDADSKAEKEGISEGVKVWVKQAREVAYQIEDAIDKHMLRLARNRDRRGFVGSLQKISSFVKKLQPHLEIASEVQHIRKTVKEVKDRSEKFQFIPSGSGASSSNAGNVILHDPRVSSLSIEEADLVAIESPRDELISLLMSGPSQRKVISVVGLGGLGKTTITRKVYDNHKVKRHFGCHAWIIVSHSYDRKELLRSILQEFYEERDDVLPQNIVTMDASLLIIKLKEYLRLKRYLVVFDDVWDVGFWGDVEHALLDDDNGSRILFTTRNEDVANFCRRSSLVHIYRMKLLDQHEAWDLFCKKAFKFEFQGKCPMGLEELSHSIVRRCGGLPLAVVAVGALLATKQKVVVEWKKLLDSLGSTLVGDPHLMNVTKILSLSYNNLPYHLKSCFLYLGMFAEDFPINCRRLIRLWVAEGFVQEKEGRMVEEVAEEYLMELINRSLVQKDKIDVEGFLKTCRVHDLVRDVILSKSEELNFCHVSSNRSTFEGIARHLSINNKGFDSPKSNTKSQTRSIIVFDQLKLQKPTIDAIFTKCKLLTALDFEKCPVDYMPEELGTLLHLRYLKLKNTKVSKLPKSIGKLHKLEFLDLRGSLVFKLPVEINSFPKLQHLLGTAEWNGGFKVRSSVMHLEFVQKLYPIKVHDVKLIKELGMLKQLRKLGIVDLKREDVRDLCISIEKMTNLQSLFVRVNNCMFGGVLEVQSMRSPPLHLQTLQLWGELERLPEWISITNNLSKLLLSQSKLMEDPIGVLQALPNLKALSLYNAYKGERMHFEEGGFPKLKWLSLAELELNTMMIDEGAMSVLVRLHFDLCLQLKELPSGIQHLKSLKNLSFYGMSDDFSPRLSSDGGEDYWIMKHVPFIKIY